MLYRGTLALPVSPTPTAQETDTDQRKIHSIPYFVQGQDIP